jgi:enoyl-CoA hydratase
MSYETIKYEVSDGIGLITINRPDVLNALNRRVLGELLVVIGRVSSDDNVKVIILTGAGKAFVAGADIAEMSKLTPREALAFGDLGHSAILGLETLDKPVIAAANGFALGGGTELCLGCDFIYASTKAKFGQPEVNLGVIPGFGGTQRLARSVGLNKARELIYTGAIIDAAEAKRIGLVSDVFEPEDLLDNVMKKAKLLMSKGPIAVAMAKRVMNKGVDLSLDSALEFEKQTFSALFGSEDRTEGMKAFLDKRKPEFKNK